MSQHYTFHISKRRCRRYVPAETPNDVIEFLKDRYRQDLRTAFPKELFCHCGLTKEEHHSDGISNASSGFKGLEPHILQTGSYSCFPTYIAKFQRNFRS